MLRKFLGLLALGFVVFYVITDPPGAAGVIHTTLSGIGTFFTDVVRGGKR